MNQLPFDRGQHDRLVREGYQFIEFVGNEADLQEQVSEGCWKKVFNLKAHKEMPLGCQNYVEEITGHEVLEMLAGDDVTVFYLL